MSMPFSYISCISNKKVRMFCYILLRRKSIFFKLFFKFVIVLGFFSLTAILVDSKHSNVNTILGQVRNDNSCGSVRRGRGGDRYSQRRS